MILTTQLTYDYYLKAQPLLQSVKQFWHDRFVLGCIGFTPTDFIGEWFRVEREDIPSYRVDYPKNRPGFVTMQNGDFAKYIDCPDEEIIICVDADTVMQRRMTEGEIKKVNKLINGFMSVSPNNPAQKLCDAIKNISGHDFKFEGFEFTSSFLIAQKIVFWKIANIYNKMFDLLPMITDHHAGNQWLLSFIFREGECKILDPVFQCALWYTGFNTTTENGLLKVDGEIVIFNHTKFNV